MSKSNKKGFVCGLKEKRDKTLSSLSEVEHFLKNFKKFSNYIKLYKIIK